MSLSIFAQAQEQIHAPLGDTLTKAIQTSSLTTPGSHPFHLKLHVRDVMDPNSDMQADIEEFWASPTLWKRTVTAPGLSQTITVNDTGTYVVDSGDYFPTWFREFVTALFDPIPNADKWNRTDNQLERTVFPSGRKSQPCLNGAMRLSDKPLSAHSSICFFENGLLATINQPGYDMEFNEFVPYQEKLVPYLYVSQPAPEIYLAGKIQLLESSNKKPSFFSTPSGATASDALSSLRISQSSLELMARGPIHITWPSVRGGKTEGTVLMFVSVDHNGHVREVSTIGTDNSELSESALGQLRQMQWEPATSKATPIQVDAVISLPFSTTLVPDATTAPHDSTIKVATGVMTGKAVLQPRPAYPEVAKQQHVQGSVYLRALIGKDGSIMNVGVIDSAAPSLTEAALDAVRRWKYQPYLLNGEPVQVSTTITVNFNFNPR